MQRESLTERLRHPQKIKKQQPAPTAQTNKNAPVTQSSSNRMALIVFGVVLTLAVVSLLFIFAAQKRAENITSFLDPSVLNGLVVDRTFTPQTNRRYVQVSEGADRNVSVTELGSTLPVISRYNFRALTQKNYEMIGVAPWALSINISSNIEDPDLLRYLFNQADMCKAFIARNTVAPLLNDPNALIQLVRDESKVRSFFNDEVAQQVLASPKVIEALAGSRLFASLLVSNTGRFFREHPEQAAQLINASPTLKALKQNAAVRKAVTENRYLKDIAPTLLK